MNSSIPWVCLNTTVETLKQMARERVFVRVGEDKIKPVNEKNVIARVNQSNAAEPVQGVRERGIDLPGFVVTYLGMKGGESAGSLCHDDRVIRILVQLIDRTDQGKATNLETYFERIAAVREWVQTNPYSKDDGQLGQVYLVHVTDESLPNEERWAIDREMKMFVVINCFARMRRTKDQASWQST